MNHRSFLYKLIEHAIKRMPWPAQALIWLLLVLLTVSNIIGAALGAFVAAIPYPFLDRRAYPPILAELIDERRAIPGRITPSLAIEISKGMVILSGLSMTASIIEPLWAVFPLISAVYMVAVIVIRHIRIIRFGYE